MKNDRQNQLLQIISEEIIETITAVGAALKALIDASDELIPTFIDIYRLWPRLWSRW